MQSLKNWSLMIMVAGLSLTGCLTTGEKIFPVHDEVLIYNLPYDLTYLRTLEALENVNDWELEETEKEKGIITVRNIAFSRLDDADKRSATVLIKRVSRNETSVTLAPQSQRVVGGDELLKRISQFLTREL